MQIIHQRQHAVYGCMVRQLERKFYWSFKPLGGYPTSWREHCYERFTGIDLSSCLDLILNHYKCTTTGLTWVLLVGGEGQAHVHKIPYWKVKLANMSAYHVTGLRMKYWYTDKSSFSVFSWLKLCHILSLSYCQLYHTKTDGKLGKGLGMGLNHDRKPGEGVRTRLYHDGSQGRAWEQDYTVMESQGRAWEQDYTVMESQGRAKERWKDFYFWHSHERFYMTL